MIFWNLQKSNIKLLLFTVLLNNKNTTSIPQIHTFIDVYHHSHLSFPHFHGTVVLLYDIPSFFFQGKLYFLPSLCLCLPVKLLLIENTPIWFYSSRLLYTLQIHCFVLSQILPFSFRSLTAYSWATNIVSTISTERTEALHFKSSRKAQKGTICSQHWWKL